MALPPSWAFALKSQDLGFRDGLGESYLAQRSVHFISHCTSPSAALWSSADYVLTTSIHVWLDSTISETHDKGVFCSSEGILQILLSCQKPFLGLGLLNGATKGGLSPSSGQGYFKWWEDRNHRMIPHWSGSFQRRQWEGHPYVLPPGWAGCVMEVP